MTEREVTPTTMVEESVHTIEIETTAPVIAEGEPDAGRALALEQLRSKFRREVIETLLLYLFTYEMPVEKVRTLLDKVEGQALNYFYDHRRAGWRKEVCSELVERLLRIESSLVRKEHS